MTKLTLSVVIPTFNSAKTLPRCLESILEQNYPHEKIEIIIADGGSTDDTILIANKYKGRIIKVKSLKQGAEYNRAVGAHCAKNGILVFLDHDNILPHNLWLQKMVQPFIDDKNIVGVETLRYHYSQNDPILGRYFSLMGVTDVLPFYLGKADRLSYMYSTPEEYGTFKKAKIEELNNYYVVNFSSDAIPTLGANGFMIRRTLLLNKAQSNLDVFFHIDVNADLIRNGFNRYAFIKDTLIHNTGVNGFLNFLRRRMIFMQKYHLTNISRRRYSVYEKKDFGRLLKIILISITVIVPLKDAVKGYLKIQDIAWFLHPFVCLGTVMIYGYTFIREKIVKNL